MSEQKRTKKKRYQRDCQHHQSGFTLIEIVITIVITVLALSGVLFASTAIQQTQEAAFEKTVAIQTAHEMIEQMRNTATTAQGNFPGTVTAAYPNNTARPGYTRLQANCGANAAPPSACNWPFVFNANNTSQEQVVVSYVNPAADPLDVTVTVVYRERGIRRNAEAVRTLITRRT